MINDDMKITRVTNPVWYVNDSTGWIFGGPFDTRREAEECLRKWKAGAWSREDYAEPKHHD